MGDTVGAKAKCLAMLEEAHDTCDHLGCFEATADLYYRRFRRLYPGKSEPMVARRSSTDGENRAQAEAWHDTGLAKFDMVVEVVRLRSLVEDLEWKIEELKDEIR